MYSCINQGIQYIPIINLVQIAVAMVRGKAKPKRGQGVIKSRNNTRDIKQFGLLVCMYIIYKVSSTRRLVFYPISLKNKTSVCVHCVCVFVCVCDFLFSIPYKK